MNLRRQRKRGSWRTKHRNNVSRIRAAAVKGGHIVHGWTWELTRAIRGDRHLPDDAGKITVGHLPRFAMWQRRIDKALGRVPPPGRGG